jgi:hypothetical protein
MHREILDPRNVLGAGPCGKVPQRLPTAVRNFGYVPEFADLRVGDLLLVAPVEPNLFQKMIISAQTECFGSEDAMWTHCAIYMGDFQICEALASGGVTVNSLLDYIPGYQLRFRSPIHATREECWSLVVRALMRLHKSYNAPAIFDLFNAIRRGAHKPSIKCSMINAGSAICSQLYADAYAEATERILVNTPSAIAMPGDLSSASTMQDRMVRWSDINRPRDH